MQSAIDQEWDSPQGKTKQKTNVNTKVDNNVNKS